MNGDARGPLLERFEVEAAREIALARLRTGVAIVVAVAAAVTLLGRLPLLVFVVCLLGLLVALAWGAQARRLRGRAATPGRYSLAVHAHGLLVTEGTDTTWVPWGDVRHIDVDEERLDIVVERAGCEPVRLEPRYPGIEIHALMHRLRNAWQATHDSGKGPKG